MNHQSSYVNDQSTLDLANKLNMKMFGIRSAFCVWKYLISIRDTDVVGTEAAQQNTNLINLHKGFFFPVETALQYRIVIELHTLFEAGKSREAIPGLVSSLAKRGKDYHTNYSRLKQDFDAEITMIDEVRNNMYAHKNIEVNQLSLPSAIRMGKLIDKISEFLNEVTAQSFGHSWIFDDEENLEAIRDTELLVDNLIRGEAARLSQIECEYRNRP